MTAALTLAIRVLTWPVVVLGFVALDVCGWLANTQPGSPWPWVRALLAAALVAVAVLTVANTIREDGTDG